MITPDIQYHLNSGYLTGPDVLHMMRRAKTTIRDLAHRMQITQKRVREVRLQGVRGREDARVYADAILMRGRWYAPGGIVDQKHGLWARKKEGRRNA